jgi:hypothetical protein
MMNAWDSDGVGVCEIALWELDWIGLDGCLVLCPFYIYPLVYLEHFSFSFLFISHWYSTTMYLLIFSLSIYLSTIIQMSFEAS